MPDPAVRQCLAWGDLRQERPSPPDTMFATAGRRMYCIGDIDGRFRPRTNPYDLYAFGHPDPNDPLANELQGVWAQPVKGLDGYAYRVEVTGEQEPWDLVDAARFTQSFAAAEFEFERQGLRAVRRDFVPQDLAVMFTTLRLSNQAGQPVAGELVFTAVFHLLDAWFTQLAEERNRGESLTIEGGCVVARAVIAPQRWAAAVQPTVEPHAVRLLESTGHGHSAEWVYPFHLGPGEEQEWTFGIAVESQGGAEAAMAALRSSLPQAERLLAEKVADYDRVFRSGPRLVAPDSAFNAAFALAQANLHFLEAESPALGRYFYAGLEMFPFWFSCDSAYALVGLQVGGLGASARNHLRIGAALREGGRIPHQASPAGHRTHSGNVEETPLWVSALWQYYRWTGDRAFLAEMYPAALEGLLGYVLGQVDTDGDGYPSGPGMVEVKDLDDETLDSAAYTWAALRHLGEMAAVLGDEPTARSARARADGIEARFNSDWWEPEQGLYAMALQADNRRQMKPYWAVVTPLEVGLAGPEHAAATFATLRGGYLNPWGLKHTFGGDERVWTLPTSLLSHAAYRYGEPTLGFEMLSDIAKTLEHGSIGLFHELIPQGACFVQLWSAGIFLRGVVEDLLGIAVDAPGGKVSTHPQLPPGWDAVRLENLRFGDRCVDVVIAGGTVKIEEKEH